MKTGTQMFMVPCFRRDGVWIPVFTGMTTFYEFINIGIMEYWNNQYKKIVWLRNF